MVYDSQREVIVLFGGRDSAGYLGDTWEYDGVLWSLAFLEGPSRHASEMIYDSARDVFVLFGGRSDAWTFENETWKIQFGELYPPLLSLSVTPQPLVAGSVANFTVTQGNPYGVTYLAYSLNGKGFTDIPCMNTRLGLYKPTQALQPKTADGNGTVSWSTTVPFGIAGPVWFQSVQIVGYGKTSNIVSTSIQ